MILTIATLGALMNRLRGGALVDLSQRFHLVPKGDERFKPAAKIANDFIFALVFTLYLNLSLTGLIVLHLSMLLGRSLGWGTYINGMIEKKVLPQSEIAIIDDLLLKKSDYPVLRNMLALSLRGLFWTASLFVGFAFCGHESMAVIFLGFLMGATYLFAMEICQRLPYLQRGNGWQLGEVFWGFIIWGGCACLLGRL